MTPDETCAVCRKPIEDEQWFVDMPDPVNGPLFWVVRHLGCEFKGEMNGN